MRVRLTQQWATFDGSHDATVPVPNRHIVTMDYYRAELGLAWPLGPVWDAELVVPWERKKIYADYELPDGTPYDNTYAIIHHRDETLTGLADFQLTLGRGWTRLLREVGDSAFVRVGITLPTGQTERDPFRRAAAGIRHQHIQFGSGTVDPLLRAGYSTSWGRWNLACEAGARIPLYENRKQYRGPPEFDFSAGPHVRISDRFGMRLQYAALYQDRASWDSATDESSGYFLQGVRWSAPITFGGDVTLAPSGMYVYDVNTYGDVGTFAMDWLFGLGLSKSI